jgi:ribose 5-phosphate isomerase
MKNKLTQNELNLLNAIIIRVSDSMKYDMELDKFTDNGNFILSLSISQMNDLIECYKKINNKN